MMLTKQMIEKALAQRSLINAAPNMLKALEDVRMFILNPPDDPSNTHKAKMLNQISKAIREAMGPTEEELHDANDRAGN